MHCNVDKLNLTLVDFYTFFSIKIQHQVISSCHEHGLIKNNKINLTNSDTKKIFYHHIVKECCEFLFANPHDVIFCLNDNGLKSSDEILQYVNLSKINLFLKNTFKGISSNLPITFLLINSSIEVLCINLNDKKGEAIDLIHNGLLKLRKIKNNQNLSKAKKFAQKHTLFFINKTFLDNLSNKAKFFI